MTASPAAAAGVSRALDRAGLKRAREIQKGVELQGYYASPAGDHVRVEYVPGPLVDEDAAPGVTADGLQRCQAALTEKYDVQQSTAMLAYPGEMRAGQVLEVRSSRWEQRGEDGAS
jgi:hypothetical protein